MRLVILDDNYPAPNNLYADVFAHVRAKRYAESHEVVVLSSWSQSGEPYVYEGIEVRPCGSVAEIARQLDALNPDAVLVHFATFPVIKAVILPSRFRFIVWVHGFEVTGWFRRLYDFQTPLHFLRYIKGNIIQRRAFRRLIQESNRSGRIRFVFVSEWIRRVAEADCGVASHHSLVISNPIDDQLLAYRPKSPRDRFNILILRPFRGRKFATDIMTAALEELDLMGAIHRFRFEVRGSHATASKMFRLFNGRPNFSFSNEFVPHRDLAQLHERNGVILAISRQDTHGVTACEAMASGLVPISSNNSAIPEYMTHEVSCLLTDNDPVSVAAAIVRLAEDEALFSRLSAGAAAETRRKSAINGVIARELKAIAALIATEKCAETANLDAGLASLKQSVNP